MKNIIFLLLLAPSLYFGFEVFYLQNQTDPIKYIYVITGAISLTLLFFTTTISLFSKWINLIKYRAMIGLFSFYYALLHFLNFLILDMELDLKFALDESIDKPFIYLGIIAFFILLFMTITSTKKLFKKYRKWHKLIYLALILVSIHFFMSQKSLSVLQQIIFAIIFLIGILKLNQLKDGFKKS